MTPARLEDRFGAPPTDSTPIPSGRDMPGNRRARAGAKVGVKIVRATRNVFSRQNDEQSSAGRFLFPTMPGRTDGADARLSVAGIEAGRRVR